MCVHEKGGGEAAWETNLVCDHGNDLNVSLPNHLPKSIEGVWNRALRGDELLWHKTCHKARVDVVVVAVVLQFAMTSTAFCARTQEQKRAGGGKRSGVRQRQQNILVVEGRARALVCEWFSPGLA